MHSLSEHTIPHKKTINNILQSDPWFDDITDAELLRRDLIKEQTDAGGREDVAYAGPYDFDWFNVDADNDQSNPRAAFASRNYFSQRLSMLGRPEEIPDGNVMYQDFFCFRRISVMHRISILVC